jgi:hypothetical protein
MSETYIEPAPEPGAEADPPASEPGDRADAASAPSQEVFDAAVEVRIEELAAELGLVAPAGPSDGEVDGWLADLEREDALATVAEGQALDAQMHELVAGWGEELGEQLDAGRVASRAAEVFAEAASHGYQASAEEAVAMLRMAAEEQAAEERGARVVADQIDREGRLLGLDDRGRSEVWELAERLLPEALKQMAPGEAARVAVSEAARAVAGQVPQSARSLARYYGDQARELRSGVAPASTPAPVEGGRSAVKSLAGRFAAQARELRV